MKRLLLLTLLLAGCAAKLGPVEFAIGDAYVKGDEVHGGPLSQGFDQVILGTVGRAIDYAASFFHAAPAPSEVK